MEFIIKGDIACSKDKDNLLTIRNGYLHVKDGLVVSTYKTLPNSLKKKKLIDHSNKLIIPGMSDLHLHASQFIYKGTAMDVTLLDWLDKYTFPIESKYKDIDFAKKAYKTFVNCLKKTFTTRAVMFATLHLEATYLLAKLLEEAKIPSYVGLVDMDRNVPDFYRHTVEEAKKDNIELINRLKDFKYAKPIITPRFTISCTDEMMEMLGEVRKEYQVAVTSHLDENPNEIAFVKELCPNSKHYADTYDKYGLLENSVQAHCIYCNDEELKLIKEKNVYIVHCPESNTNVSTGAICPVKKYLDMGLNIGMGSDVAGGSTLNLLKNLKLAIQLSKTINYGHNTDYKPLTAEEAFYLGTLGGGRYFGNVGTFKEGFEADIVIVDDLKSDPSSMKFSIRDRIERLIYSGEDSMIVSKYIKGNKII